jgi:plasmid stabilization system protein ParE
MSYIGQRNRAAALTWRDEMFGLFQLLAGNPHAGVSPKKTKLPVRMFPKGNYVVLYQVDDGDVDIIRVIHAAQDCPDIADEFWRLIEPLRATTY